MTLFAEEELEQRPALEGPVVRVRLTVAYDGKPFRGFASQRGTKTVGGTLAAALERVLRHPVDMTCAGRTDAGVHGWGQVVSFDAQVDDLDLDRLQRAVNKLCAPAIVVREAAIAPDGFDARRSAVARRYRYTVLNRSVPDPFLAATAWLVEEDLDLAPMRLGCDPLIGEHDFTSFCRVPRRAEHYTMVRRVTHASWTDLGEGLLCFEIEASAFCQQMVRSVVGFLVDVGRGRRKAGELTGVIAARDRSQAGTLAPAHGLCLWHVRY